MKILQATQRDMIKVRELFREYQQWLGIDLCFQGFEQELAALPGKYAPPLGAIFIAIDNNDVIGCVAFRSIAEGEAELKRLYVRPQHQGSGIGKQLFHTAMSKVQMAGYSSIVLDTLPSMQQAMSLYLHYGFKPIPAYYNNPVEGVEYYRYVFDQ